MQNYQREFIAFALELGALRFGEFKLKSGRLSPYFFNTGAFNSGRALGRLGRAYAAAMVASGIRFDMLFGPAYKGIPLGTAVAIALSEAHELDVPVAFNRKEAKDHGEGGTLLGAPLGGRVLIVDDVISAGTSVNESMQFINAAGASAAGVFISLDRQERGQGEESAVAQIERNHGMPVGRIVGLDDIVEYLEETGQNADNLRAIEAYRREYGVAAG